MEPSSAGGSKAGKKNKKKKQHKKAGDGSHGPVTAADLLPLLKRQLEEAKAAKDHVLAGTLRDQLWVVTDLANGVKTEMDKAEYAAIIATLPLGGSGNAATTGGSGGDGKPASGGGGAPDSRIRTLRKKLDQIADLRVKQSRGDTLEQNQAEKIKNESSIRQELEELEKLMQELQTKATSS